MSSGWLPKHRQLFFQIFEEGSKAELGIRFHYSRYPYFILRLFLAGCAARIGLGFGSN